MRSTSEEVTFSDDFVPSNEPKQLFRYNGPLDEAYKLLESKDLSEQDVIDFLQKGVTRESEASTFEKQQLAYRKRRVEIQRLLQKIPTGGARVDEEGRLVEIEHEEPAPPRINLPPPPQVNAALEVAAQQVQAQNAEAQENQPRLMIRVAAVIFTAFAAMLYVFIQPYLSYYTPISPNVKTDRILRQTLDLRMLTAHYKHCPNLHRQPTLTWTQRLQNKILKDKVVDCADGVLHIPALSVIQEEYLKAKTVERLKLLEPFVTNGIDHSWFFPCSSNAPRRDGSTCAVEDSRCFRGVHDDILNERDVGKAVNLGIELIDAGGDHFDIHGDIDKLKPLQPIVKKVQTLLQERYSVNTSPVAFRIYAVAPSDGTGVALSLKGLLNTTNYFEHMDRVRRNNELAQYSPPWPFNINEIRDTCKLMADLEANEDFHIHTTAYLSDGAGEDFWGGVSLYVDDHPSNRNKYKRIARGMTVDGTMGRLIVSTGGVENRRCHFPVRGGVRATLQIWWKKNLDESGHIDI